MVSGREPDWLLDACCGAIRFALVDAILCVDVDSLDAECAVT